MFVQKIRNHLAFLMEANNGGDGTGGAGGKSGVLGDNGEGAGPLGGGANGVGSAGDKGAGNENPGGQGGNDPGSNDPSGGAAGKKVEIPQNWQDALSDEVKNSSNIGTYKTVEDLARGLLNAQKLVGADKIAIPKNASDQELRAVYEKLGLPQDQAKYELTAPKDAGIDTKMTESFKQEAFKLGILPKQAQGLLNLIGEQNKTLAQTQAQQETLKFEADLKAIRDEWGDSYQENAARAKAALAEFGASKEDIKYFTDNLTVSGPVLRLLAKAGATLDEGKIRGAGGGGNPGYTPQEAIAKIAEIKAKGAYFDTKASDHLTDKAEVQRLYKIANPTKK